MKRKNIIISKETYLIEPQYHKKYDAHGFVLRLKYKFDSRTMERIKYMTKELGGFYTRAKDIGNGYFFFNEENAIILGNEIENDFDFEIGISQRRYDYILDDDEDDWGYDIDCRSSIIEKVKQIVREKGQLVLEKEDFLSLIPNELKNEENQRILFVIEIMIKKGYMKKLLSIGKWGFECNNLANEISYKLGFTLELTSSIVIGLAYSLGWKHFRYCLSPDRQCSVKLIL